EPVEHPDQPPAAAVGAPVLRHHRDSLLPAVAAALSLKSGEVHTLAGRKVDAQPVHHPLIAEFLVSLPVEHRERFLGRCPETLLLAAARSVEHSVFPAAVEAWAEFGGLSFDLSGAGRFLARTPFLLDPRCGLHQSRTLADLGRALGSRVAPLGEELYGQALLAI